MYSYADRLRAVELYIRLGKRLNATIRQLGYPTKNALRGWYREYVQYLDLRTQPVARVPKYSEAQRQAALEHFCAHDRCISATMRALGYPGRGTLTAWVREAFPETRTSMVGRSWHPGYSDEVRQAGVIGLCSGDESAQQVADGLGVSRPTLYSWKEQLLGHEAPSCQSAQNIHPFYLSNFHPPVGDQRLACPALSGVAEGRPSAGDGCLRL